MGCRQQEGDMQEEPDLLTPNIPAYGILRINLAEKDSVAELVGRFSEKADAMAWILKKRARRNKGDPIVHFIRLIG